MFSRKRKRLAGPRQSPGSTFVQTKSLQLSRYVKPVDHSTLKSATRYSNSVLYSITIPLPCRHGT